MIKRGTHPSLADIITSVSDAQVQTVTRGGRWHGRYGTLSCPLCQPEARAGQNALTLADGRKGLLLHCKKAGCSFRDLTAALGISHGPNAVPDPAVIARRETGRLAEVEKRARQSQALWSEASLTSGTIAETYLRGRGINCALPDTLRYHPMAWHLSGRHLPALVARVDGCDGFAVHRTYLRQDGNGKADVEPQKAMLGRVKGGAVRLARVPGPLVVAEGIETALSLACGLLNGPASIWAALSTSGMTGLHLPSEPGRLTIAPDGDKAGHVAALTLADRATRDGWLVSILTPPEGGDFNDLMSSEVWI
ncbi:Toprim domain-containing protein [Pseudorhodobacter antarcticus]|uniref:Toprim domain-containing protein n=1 Tax=Pseudorhodobacter antarcticus TaxID=1077947 RepID=A0A1H8M0Z0_9RHOB|nr:Toprim domain-containing protein [Pseudorhodobacter antarcticus]